MLELQATLERRFRRSFTGVAKLRERRGRAVTRVGW